MNEEVPSTQEKISQVNIIPLRVGHANILAKRGITLKHYRNSTGEELYLFDTDILKDAINAENWEIVTTIFDALYQEMNNYQLESYTSMITSAIADKNFSHSAKQIVKGSNILLAEFLASKYKYQKIIDDFQKVLEKNQHSLDQPDLSELHKQFNRLVQSYENRLTDINPLKAAIKYFYEDLHKHTTQKTS